MKFPHTFHTFHRSDKFSTYYPSLLTKLDVSPPLESLGNKSNWKINFGPALHRFPNDLCTKRLTNFRGALLLAISPKVITCKLTLFHHLLNTERKIANWYVLDGLVMKSLTFWVDTKISSQLKREALFFHMLTSYVWLFWPTHLQSWEGPRSKLELTALRVMRPLSQVNLYCLHHKDDH